MLGRRRGKAASRFVIACGHAFGRKETDFATTMSEASPFISVVLPVHNGEKYLRESIDSVLLQDYPHFEFIIWDDHATDSSAQIIDSYEDSRIRRFAN